MSADTVLFCGFCLGNEALPLVFREGLFWDEMLPLGWEEVLFERRMLGFGPDQGLGGWPRLVKVSKDKSKSILDVGRVTKSQQCKV